MGRTRLEDDRSLQISVGDSPFSKIGTMVIARIDLFIVRLWVRSVQLSFKNTGRKPPNPSQYINLGPKSKLGDYPYGPEPGSDEFIMLNISKRFETGSGYGDNARALCMEILDGLPCIHSIPCPEHSQC